mmetsp:Transcript_52233/g.113805  ORF Transcript_52233/g.113805 Transcript_52233/m.113805 type:complete len:260 (-) Transcript_52233:1127-1906(-)
MHVCTFAGMCTRARACTHRHHGSSSNVRSLARAATEVGKQHHRRVLRAPQFVKLPVPVLAASQKRSARVEERLRALGARRVLEIGARFGVGGRRVERGHQESTSHAAHLLLHLLDEQVRIFPSQGHASARSRVGVDEVAEHAFGEEVSLKHWKIANGGEVLDNLLLYVSEFLDDAERLRAREHLLVPRAKLRPAHRSRAVTLVHRALVENVLVAALRGLDPNVRVLVAETACLLQVPVDDRMVDERSRAQSGGVGRCRP